MSDFTPQHSITLPVFGTKGASILGASMLAAARAEKLPRPLVRAAAKLKRAHQDLLRAMRERVPEPASPEVRAAQRREAKAWTALRYALKAVAAVPEEEHAERRETALRLEATLFAKGSGFGRLTYKLAWAEAEERLERIDEEELAKPIRALTGDVYLEAAKRAHRASGEVLGITKAKAPRPSKEMPPVQRVLAELRTAMREFVVLVEAHRLAGAREEADRLLAPLVDWQKTRRRRRAKQAPASAPAEAPATPLTP